MDRLTIGGKLKKLRKAEGMTQQVLADEFNIKQDDISRYENDKQELNLSILSLYCKRFKVSADYLLGLTENPTVDTDVRAVCDYTGLSEQAVMNLHDFFYKNATNDACADRLDAINFFFTYVPKEAGIDEYFKRFTRTVHRYNAHISENIHEKQEAVPTFRERVEQLKLDSSMDYIFPEDINRIDRVNKSEKDMRYNGFELQDLARDFINDFFTKERRAYSNISSEYFPLYEEMMELHSKNGKGGKHGDDQEA